LCCDAGATRKLMKILSGSAMTNCRCNSIQLTLVSVADTLRVNL
jgi:hypothetical protein